MWKIKSEDFDSFNNVSEHLEFLGYKIEQSEASKDLRYGFHDTFMNLIIINISGESKSNISEILFRAGGRIENVEITLERLKIINDLNKRSMTSRLTIEKDDEDTMIYIYSTYLGPYKQKVFSRFWERLKHDQDLITQNVNKLISDD